MKHVFFSLPIFLCLFACKPEVKTSSAASIQDTLNTIVETVFSNSEKLDVDKALSRFLKTDQFSFISNGQVVTIGELERLERDFFNTLDSQDFEFIRQRSDILSDSCAMIELFGTLTSYPKKKMPIKYQIAETAVIKKINGSWFLTSGHESYYPIPLEDSIALITPETKR